MHVVNWNWHEVRIITINLMADTRASDFLTDKQASSKNCKRNKLQLLAIQCKNDFCLFFSPADIFLNTKAVKAKKISKKYSEIHVTIMSKAISSTISEWERGLQKYGQTTGF